MATSLYLCWYHGLGLELREAGLYKQAGNQNNAEKFIKWNVASFERIKEKFLCKLGRKPYTINHCPNGSIYQWSHQVLGLGYENLERHRLNDIFQLFDWTPYFEESETKCVYIYTQYIIAII